MPEFTALVADTLRGLGYSVGVNSPFKGAEIVIRHGAPAQNRHSLQIESQSRASTWTRSGSRNRRDSTS